MRNTPEYHDLNWLGTAWYTFLFIFMLLSMATVYIWAVPGFFLERLFTKLGWEEKGVVFAMLAFWMAPLWLFSILVSRPPKEVPKWARKKDSQEKKNAFTKRL